MDHDCEKAGNKKARELKIPWSWPQKTPGRITRENKTCEVKAIFENKVFYHFKFPECHCSANE
jgi:hypothetical protein